MKNVIEVNIEMLMEHIKEEYRGNRSMFAEKVNIDRHYLGNILQKKNSASSPKLIRNLISYCKKNDLDYQKFIKMP